MNIIKTIKQYDNNCVYFCEPIKNNIMTNGNFIRILYSNHLFVLNGIYLSLPIQFVSIDKYYNKYKCSFDASMFSQLIDDIKSIEYNLLAKYVCDKTPHYSIYEQLRCGFIKVFSDIINRNNSTFFLKIAGIWETESEYGLTYKFMVA